MKTSRAVSVAAIVMILIFTGTGCGKDGAGIFLPNLTLTWYNKTDATNTNTFFFLNATQDVSSSTFTGNENPVGGGTQRHFSGSFTSHQIQFTYDNSSGAKSGKSYSGTINDASNLITLNSTDLGSLVLEKR